MRRTVVRVVTLLFAGALLVTPAGGTAAASGRRPLFHIALNDVTVIAANDVWAVGDGGIASHWNGTSWSSRHLGGLRSPELNGVDARTTDDVWAVGGVIVQDAFRGFASRWDGSAWHRTPVPGYPGEMILADVAVRSNDDAEAVGRWFAVTPGGRRGGAAIVHWNGTRWARDRAPANVSRLDAVTRLGGGAFLAVGTSMTGDPLAVRIASGGRVVVHRLTEPSRAHCRAGDVTTSPLTVVGSCRYATSIGRRVGPYIVERRGGAWRLASAAGSASLWGVGAGNPTWAVGRSSATGRPVTLRRRPDGARWFRVSTPQLPRGGLLQAVDTRTFNDAWSVGWRRVGTSRRPLALRWDGASWTAVHVPLA